MSDLPPELRRLFADEAGTRLARLAEELLALEESGADSELVASVFRDAHTLKGSAGMMGFTEFAAVAHRMEDLLEGVRAGTRPPTAALIDGLLGAVDGLRAHLETVVAGQPDVAALGALTARLAALLEEDGEEGGDGEDGPAPAEHPADRVDEGAAPQKPAAPAPVEERNAHGEAGPEAAGWPEADGAEGGEGGAAGHPGPAGAAGAGGAGGAGAEPEGEALVEAGGPGAGPAAAGPRDAGRAREESAPGGGTKPKGLATGPGAGAESGPGEGAATGPGDGAATGPSAGAGAESAPGAPGAPGAGAESGPGAGPAGAGDAGAATAGAAPTAGTTTELRPEPPPASARTTQARRRDRGQDTIRVPLARLDELSRLIGEAGAAHARAVAALVEDLGGRAAIPADLHVLEGLLHDLQDRTSRTRMVPVARVVEPLRRAVRDVARAQGKDVRFDVAGDETELDRGILDTLADPLLHLVRNAVDHGIEPAEVRAAQGKPEQAQVRLAAAATASSVVISVGDDGRGLDLDRIRAAAAPTTTTTHAAAAADPIGLLFQPGFSTAAQVTDVSGRGVGLDVVRSTLETLSGRIDVHSEPGRGCVFTITVPLTMASVACLVLKAGGRPYAIPLDNVAATVEPQPDHRSLADVLGVPVTAPPTAGVVVTDGRRTATFAVASVVDHRGLVVRGLGRIMPPLPVVAGAALQADGSVVVVLDPAGLLDRAAEARTAADEARHAIPPANAAATPQAAGRPHRILVVDDSAVVRQTQHAVLTRAGYEVQTAVDGADALARLQEWPADLALVDVRMPVMDGLALTAALRADPRFAGIAVLIVTSRATDEDRRRGMEAGADGYVVKGTFTSDHLLDAVAGLLGQDR